MMSTPSRTLGDSTVHPIGYGAMGIAGYYGPVQSDEERLKVLDGVYNSGSRHWDTADVYADSEELLGRWFKRTGKRNEIFLATKFGIIYPDPLPDGRTVCGDADYVHKSLQKSLRRLGTDYIDLWYYHRIDKTVPIEITIRAMAEHVRAGKVKYIGLSEPSADTIRRAHAVHPITAIEVEYSPFTLDIEDEKLAILKTARELGIKIVAYSPVGRGLLTGKIRSRADLDPSDFRLYFPRFSEENFPKILKIVDVIKAVADNHGATPGQVALAWLLAQGDDILPIPGSTKIANIKENVAAASIALTRDEVERIRDAAVAADKTLGDRYPPNGVALLYADTPPLK